MQRNGTSGPSARHRAAKLRKLIESERTAVESAGALLERVVHGEVVNKPQAAGHALADRVLKGHQR